MLFSLWPIFVLLLALSIPSVGPGNVQSYNSQSVSVPSTGTQIGDSVASKITTSADNEEKNISSPFVNNTESSVSNTTNVVINEVELNPPGNDSSQQWIELYNPADLNANISDLYIQSSFKSTSVDLPSDALIRPNGIYVVELYGQVLSKTAESLVLANSTGEIIDRTPSLLDRANDGRTWQRIPDGNNEWQFTEGTSGELNDPDQQAGATHSASSALQCLGTAGCAEGTVTSIVDGDTIHVNVNGTVYRIDLALTRALQTDEPGVIDSTLFTRSLCLGNKVLVDQDDKLLTSPTSIIAVVYCGSANLNSELLENGNAALETNQCNTSEFANESWAKEHGC